MATDIIILAAGQGTRMKSSLPKVLHTVCGEAMLPRLLKAADKAIGDVGGASFNIVVGHGKDAVIAAVKALVDDGRIKAPVRFTVQEQQRGTGHAVKLALEAGGGGATVAVLNGDLPLMGESDLREFFAAHAKAKSHATLASAVGAAPTGYGRVVRKGGTFLAVVEEKDATPKQRAIKEVNGGIYLFRRDALTRLIPKLKSANKAGEFYLPDLFQLALKSKMKTLAHVMADGASLLGANNMAELAEAERLLRQRINNHWMKEGVRLIDPATTYIGSDVQLAPGVVIGPGTIIEGTSRIGEGVAIGAHCVLRDVSVAYGAVIKAGVVAEKAEIGMRTAVGPMAHFRPGTIVAEDAKIGNFVEIKASTIGAKTSVSHLSYVGDAQIGKRVNIGCGFVTCNYDGKSKHKSIIGDDVFIGSDSQVVAPIEIAAGTYVGSGSTVTESVPEPDSLVIARTRQVTKPGYAKRYRKS